jgi:DNA (cytosine-5)-methyltransferase 1
VTYDAGMAEPLSVIDLFAGCGGMSIGFRDQGFTSIMAVEHDLHAAATYAANFGEDHVHHCDIATIGDDEIPQARVVIGGPPCQGFSNLGSRDVNDPRNKLWKEYLRFVQIAQPDVFVLENVSRFRSSSEFELLLKEATDGMIKDYELVHGVLIAADYGVPQRRPRTIVIGSKVGRIPLPTPTHGKIVGLDIEPWTTVRSRIGALPPKPSSTALPEQLDAILGERLPGRYKGVDLHIGRNPRPESMARYESIPEGGNRFDIPPHMLSPCWVNKPTGTTDVMGRMRWDQPSLTIRTEFFKPEKGRYLHPVEHRPITHYEAALLQDFPLDYEWFGNKVSIARQIGNAVPVGLAAAVADQVKKHLV